LTNEVEEKARRELELTRIVANLLEEQAQMQDPDSKLKKKKKRTLETVQNELKQNQTELQQIQDVPKTGWILIDFPTSFSQAMLLEKALSGYQ